MLNVESALANNYPNLQLKLARPFYQSLVFTLNKLLHVRDINHFLEHYGDYEGLEFIEKVFDYLNFDYAAASNEKLNIPATGRVMIIANHPLGALDSLAILKLIGEVRKDVKIVANDVLMQFDQLSSLLLPVNNMQSRTSKTNVKMIIDALENDEAVIIFPSGEVSRARPNGVKDVKWNGGFLRFASKTNTPLLPIYIDAKNSMLFYATSALFKPLSTLLLAHEMFNKRNSVINLKIGEVIPFSTLGFSGIANKAKIRLLKRHMERIGRGKKGVFETQKCIAHPENRQELKQELKESEVLGKTRDNKTIYLCSYRKNSALMREIGRLREYSFRKVGEGSGSKRDLDSFDRYYKHLVLWDEEALEVVGAYRLGESWSVFDHDGFYSAGLFKFHENFDHYLIDSIELGRSFVQPRYWGSRALDYLWQGIGAYLKANPHVRYMFGPVSLSDTYPIEAKRLIAKLYLTHFGDPRTLVSSNSPFDPEQGEEPLPEIIHGEDYEEDFKAVREHLAYYGLSIPTLYKQYSDVCEEGGVKFLEFGIDADFGNCIDGFILVDIDRLKPAKRKRYIG